MTAARTGLERIAAARRRQALTEGATPAGDRQYTGGQLIAAARCYLDAANAVRAALHWATGAGPRLAELYSGAHRDAVLAEVERALADPVGWHYGRDRDTPGSANLPSQSEWLLAPGMWRPSNDPVTNLAAAGALVAREIDRQLAELDTDTGADDTPAPAAGRRWVLEDDRDPYWADPDGHPLATVEVYPADRVGRSPQGKVLQAEAEAALRQALSLATTPAPPGARCQSCPASADLTLPDGSHWCGLCDGAARRLGYDSGGEGGDE